VEVAAHHLAQVVAGGESDPRAFDDDRLDVGARSKRPQRSRQLVHELEREGVALVRPIQGDPGGRGRVGEDQ
jgi:hypothetical protein